MAPFFTKPANGFFYHFRKDFVLMFWSTRAHGRIFDKGQKVFLIILPTQMPSDSKKEPTVAEMMEHILNHGNQPDADEYDELEPAESDTDVDVTHFLSSKQKHKSDCGLPSHSKKGTSQNKEAEPVSIASCSGVVPLFPRT